MGGDFLLRNSNVVALRPEVTERSALLPVSDDTSKAAGKWFANAMLISGAVLISVSPKLAVTAWVFSLFLVGHLLWAAYSIRKGDIDRPQLALNIAYIALDVYAIAIRL